ncbi:MAG: sugar transferase [Bryobacteraceae bacterium]|nr:sugar transferase [Bryobacteraceae bacterium]
MLDILLCAVSLLIAVSVASALSLTGDPDPLAAEVAVQILLTAIIFGLLLSAQEEGRLPKAWVLFVEISSLGIGVGLIGEATALYLGVQPLSLEILIGGQLLAAALLTARRRIPWLQPPPPSPYLVFVGFEPEVRLLLPTVAPRLLGILDDAPPSDCATATDVRYLGHAEQAIHPLPEWRTLVVSPRALRSLEDPTALMNARRQGVAVKDLAAFYEQTLLRVCSGLLRPVDFLFSRGTFMASRHAMAAQAVYNNLIGLTLLILIFPVLFLTAVAVALLSGRGPVFEVIECAGFQGIPFQLLRFRTRRWDSAGGMTPIGSLLTRLRLVNLPMFINVVRGELALFGPRSIRVEFHERLCQLIPFYFHRSSVKPGIFGWSQLNLSQQEVVDEVLRLEYDFYYIRKVSPSLDLQVFLQTIFRAR